MTDAQVTRTILDRWMLLAWLGAGAFMVWGASHYTVFDDEALSHRLYVMPLGDMLSALWRGADPDPPLYYFLVNIWVKVFGDGPLQMRGLSILLFLAALFCLRAAADLRFGRRVGLATLAICCCHPAHLFFGFAARWYSCMFLAVAILLWATGRCAQESRSRMFVCGLAAAAVCYTNYFGPVVVAFVFLSALLSDRKRILKWVAVGVLTVLLYTPWVVPFFHEVRRFPGNQGSILATAARTFMTLLTGNLAGVGAWWVWVPAALFGLLILVRLAQSRPFAWSVAIPALGCLIVGIASRTLIDKYVMVISGPVCIWVATLLAKPMAESAGKWVRQLSIAALVLMWLGCVVNLVTEKHWSSLRWLDPFEQVVLSELRSHKAIAAIDWVATHPSVGYYYARHRLRVTDQMPGTPDSVRLRLRHGGPPRILVIETTDFAASAIQTGLDALLKRQYVLDGEPAWHLEDHEAEWKDRIDPAFSHPRWRITVTRWRRR